MNATERSIARHVAENHGLDWEVPVDRIVAGILSDVTDRRGWKQAWASFDVGVRVEILESWRSRVAALLTEV